MINGIGFFKIHRELFNKPIWANSNPIQKTVLMTLIAMANFKPNDWEFKGEKYEVKAGQFITSLDSITKNCGKGITKQNVRTSLKRFKEMEFLTDESTNRNRLITIVNWASYQVEEENQQAKQHATNMQPTCNQHATNMQLTPREERKNDKKDKKDKNVIKYNDESIPYQAALFLRGKILEVNPNTKVPKENINSLQEWSDIIRKTLEIDKRPREELGKIIKFALEHDFWNSVIQSPKSLRKNYDKIYAQYNRNSKCKIEKNIEASKKWLEKRAENE